MPVKYETANFALTHQRGRENQGLAAAQYQPRVVKTTSPAVLHIVERMRKEVEKEGCLAVVLTPTDATALIEELG